MIFQTGKFSGFSVLFFDFFVDECHEVKVEINEQVVQVVV